MKKKLLAGLLSFTMLTGQMLPVVAADDADVTVSEDVVYEEEGAEEEGAEEEAETIVVEEEVTNEAEAVSLASIYKDYEGFDDIVVEEDGEYTYVTGVKEVAEINLDNASDIEIPEADLDEAAASQIILGGAAPFEVNAGTIQIGGDTYDVSAKGMYNSIISYRGRKIKVIDNKKDGLIADVQSGGLYNMVKSLATPGISDEQLYYVLKWKYTAKKNKNANAGAYFTVKATVSSKEAKRLGITGKSLKALKKAVKQFNKTAKKTQIPFTIMPLNLDYAWGTGEVYVYQEVKTSYWRGIQVSKKVTTDIRVRVDNSQPASVGKTTRKKWYKLTSKDAKITTIKELSKIRITPLGGNVTGTDVIVDLVLGKVYPAN